MAERVLLKRSSARLKSKRRMLARKRRKINALQDKKLPGLVFRSSAPKGIKVVSTNKNGKRVVLYVTQNGVIASRKDRSAPN